VWYAIISEDNEDSLAKRLAARPDHLSRLAQLVGEGRLLVAGAQPAVDSPDPGPAGLPAVLLLRNLNPSKTHARGPKPTRTSQLVCTAK